ncbi:CoA-binding protein [Helicobacter cholecystus]|uniref:CoA-binding protein n=1 Tax=Helicobacter cholecystus TaxID=45498 RepID=UPI002738EEFF|nr:CoA-binding protein [Helicobacter cholecystus]
MQIQELLKISKNIAIIGLSPLPSKPSFQVASYLQTKGYKIFPIYPRGEEILGEKVYKDLDELQEEMDIFLIFRNGEKCYTITQEILSSFKPKAIWLQLGICNQEAKALAVQKGVMFVQDCCIKIEREKYECKKV